MKNINFKSIVFFLLFLIPNRTYSKYIKYGEFRNVIFKKDTTACDKKINKFLTKNINQEANKIKNYKFGWPEGSKIEFKNLNSAKSLVLDIKGKYAKEGVDLNCLVSCQIIANFVNMYLDSCGYKTKKIFVGNLTKPVYSLVHNKEWFFHAASLIFIKNSPYVIDFPSSNDDSSNYVLPQEEWEKRSFRHENGLTFLIAGSDTSHIRPAPWKGGSFVYEGNSTGRKVQDSFKKIKGFEKLFPTPKVFFQIKKDPNKVDKPQLKPPIDKKEILKPVSKKLPN